MMRRLVLLFLLFSSVSALAQRDTLYYYVNQQLKQVDKAEAKFIFKMFAKDGAWVVDKFNDKLVIQQEETYTDSLLSVKIGEHKEYVKGKLSLVGQFSNNKKNGNFTSYAGDGRIKEIKTYSQDTLKSRVVYYFDGKTIGIQETYANGKVLNTSYFDLEGKPTEKFEMEAPPSYPGGISKFYEFVARTINYPRDAASSESVLVSFVVSETGVLEDFKIEKSVSPILDNEALRVIKRSKPWIPAKQYGKAVRVKYTMPFKFR